MPKTKFESNGPFLTNNQMPTLEQKLFVIGLSYRGQTYISQKSSPKPEPCERARLERSESATWVAHEGHMPRGA